MAETKFTPGPWEHHVSDVRGTLCVIAENTWICGELWNDVAPLTEAEAKANAHLIAAAPELYYALTALINRYVSLVRSGDADFWDPEAEEEVINARDALAKARGEAV
nr:hypothetical protein [Ochrobactrum sp. UNC390CL2Tsu3S39]